jgi:ABC-type Fe3+-citrate transport system substrate-binding protein
MKKTLKKNLAKIEEEIKNYMTILDSVDKEDSCQSKLKIDKDDIKKLAEKKEQLTKDLELLDTLGKEQYNKTDHDATAVSKLSHNLMGYNSQIAVDHTYKFIVATDISTNGHDLDQLHLPQ